MEEFHTRLQHLQQDLFGSHRFNMSRRTNRDEDIQTDNTRYLHGGREKCFEADRGNTEDLIVSGGRGLGDVGEIEYTGHNLCGELDDVNQKCGLRHSGPYLRGRTREANGLSEQPVCVTQTSRTDEHER